MRCGHAHIMSDHQRHRHPRHQIQSSGHLQEPIKIRVEPAGGLAARLNGVLGGAAAGAHVPPAHGADVAVRAHVDDGDLAVLQRRAEVLLRAGQAARVEVGHVVEVDGPGGAGEDRGQVGDLEEVL